MNKKWVIAIIGIMSLVLATLISIQVYWIKNAIVLKEKQFDQNVSEALNEVANNLEKTDAMTFIMDEFITNNSYDKSLDRKIRWLHNQAANALGYDVDFMFQQFDKDIQEMKELVNSFPAPYFPKMKFDFDTVIHLDSSKGGVYNSVIRIQVDDSVHDVNITANSTQQLRKVMSENVRKIEHRKNVMNDLFFQFFSEDRTINERIDKEELNVLISRALHNKGIDIPFEYVVINRHSQPIAQSASFDPNAFSTASKIQLFPNDMFSESSHLAIQFPSKRGYIIQSLGLMSFSSMGLILIISLCFAYTIYIIFRQKKLSDMKTDFINNMTHEFKTPVSTISLASEMLKDKNVVYDKQQVQKYADVIFDENKRLGGQVEKVLQMAVLDKGNIKLKLTPINIHDLIQTAVDKLSLQIESKNVDLDLRLNAKNPKAKIDETHFVNIILNLLDNAIKYSEEIPYVKVETKDTNNGLAINISDKGIGMSKEDQKRVFEKFYRVPKGNLHDVKGFGLGLSYVKAMVEAHGGRIFLKSEMGKGTTFKILIPHSYSKNGKQV